jgi:hypothetical protein
MGSRIVLKDLGDDRPPRMHAGEGYNSKRSFAVKEETS